MISVFLVVSMLMPDPAKVASLTPNAITRFVAALHRLEWSQVTVADAEKILGVALRAVDVEIPPDSQYKTDSCDGSVYATFESVASSATLEFRKHPSAAGSKCDLRLHALRADAVGDARDVESALVEAISRLEANGRTCDTDPDYRWRSDDSLTLFDLSAATSAVDANRKRLSLKLRHIAISPDKVSDLPFRNGFVLPAPPFR